jgi:hypothetical protein|tara:strand:+ start:249 stop:599 length:351 start_codon:yes stop_codon:yes gene_type:complete
MDNMMSEMYGGDARRSKRLDLAFPIMLNGHNGETKTISSTGVYFEVITDDMEIFSPGRTIPFQINAFATTAGFDPRDLKLYGNGSIVRNDIKNISSHGNRLGVAIEFKEKLDLQMV